MGAFEMRTRINSTYGFYYNNLSEWEKTIYDAVLKGILKMNASFAIPKCDYQKLDGIYDKIQLDCPEIFYIEALRTKPVTFKLAYRVRPVYRLGPGEVKNINAGIERASEGIISRCAGKTEREKVKLIQDYIISDMCYGDAGNPYSHNIAGMFLNKIGVCEGLAKTFKYLCDRAGLYSGVIIGHVNGVEELHAWNAINIAGKWYETDLTPEVRRRG